MLKTLTCLNRVGIDAPRIEVRFEHLSVEGDAYVGTIALPTLVNIAMNKIEVVPPVILIISADNLFDSNHVEHAEKRSEE